jgi:hypothetical protein
MANASSGSGVSLGGVWSRHGTCIVLRILSIFLGWVDSVLCLPAHVIEAQNHG